MTPTIDIPMSEDCKGRDPIHTHGPDTAPVLRVDGLSVGLHGQGAVRSVIEDVSFTVRAGEVVALLGESGCGKSVTAQALMQLLPPAMSVTGGRVVLDGRDMSRLSGDELRSLRGGVVSMIFQDPMSSLNPLMTVGAQIAEALVVHGRCRWREARKRAIELLDLVRIPAPDIRARDYPHSLSGGMRQRVMIAIALACQPKLIIADEPTTALDVTIQRQIIDLLRDLQKEQGIGLLLITHDFGVVSELADRITVMYAGRVVEQASTPDLIDHAVHPYTRALLRAMPSFSRSEAPHPGARLAEIGGAVPALGQRPDGCTFRPRCAIAADKCALVAPPLIRVGEGRRAACHFAHEDAA